MASQESEAHVSFLQTRHGEAGGLARSEEERRRRLVWHGAAVGERSDVNEAENERAQPESDSLRLERYGVDAYRSINYRRGCVSSGANNVNSVNAGVRKIRATTASSLKLLNFGPFSENKTTAINSSSALSPAQTRTRYAFTIPGIGCAHR
jgi:hypothetical protein